jgi:hypothetical protein
LVLVEEVVEVKVEVAQTPVNTVNVVEVEVVMVEVEVEHTELLVFVVVHRLTQEEVQEVLVPVEQ